MFGGILVFFYLVHVGFYVYLTEVWLVKNIFGKL